MAVSLANFDPQVVAEYNITADDLRRVEHYLRLLQGPDAPALKDIAVGGYYGTSALLHEVVELDILLEWANTTMRDFDLLAESDWSGHLLVPDTAAVDRARRLLVRLREVDL